MDDHRFPGRTPRGRFAPGCSGNPAGRPKGSRNWRTIIEQALREGEGVALARELIEAAHDGDRVTGRFVVGRLVPAPRGARIAFDLPADRANLHEVFLNVLEMLAAGEMSGEDAWCIARFLKEKSGIEHYYPGRRAEAVEDATEAETEDEAEEEIETENPAPLEPAADQDEPVSGEEDFAEKDICRGGACPAREPRGEAATAGRASPAPTDSAGAAAAAPPPLALGGSEASACRGSASEACARAGEAEQAGEGEVHPAAAGKAPPKRSEEELRALWLKGELSGPELREFGERELRRLGRWNRGFQTIYVRREDL